MSDYMNSIYREFEKYRDGVPVDYSRKRTPDEEFCIACSEKIVRGSRCRFTAPIHSWCYRDLLRGKKNGT